MTLVDAAVSIIFLILFLIIFYGPWNWVCVDWARQSLFEKRDKLFDMAIKGEINFNSPAYKDTRETLNGLIRFAHKLTLPKMLFLLFYRRNAFPEKFDAIKEINKISNEETRAKIINIIILSHKSLLKLILSTSLISLIFLPLIILTLVVGYLLLSIDEKIGVKIKSLKDHASLTILKASKYSRI